MTVVLAVDALSPAPSGIGRYAWELATRLPQRLGADGVRFYREGRWVAKPETLLQPTPAGAAKAARCFPLSSPRWLARRLMTRACRGQVFHGPNYFLPPCADIGVATVHDLSVFKFPETHPVARIRQFEREFKATLARAVHLVTDSEATRLEVIDFLAWPAARISAIPLGVAASFAPAAAGALQLERYGLRRGGYTLCVSTMEPRKRIGNLLHAYQCLPAPLRQRYPLVLAGGAGWLSEALHQEIERLSAQGWLRYLGFVPETDLAALYNGARAFCYPSIYEGFGLPVLEAMASGVPVICANRSSLPEVSQGAARLVDPDDIEALAAALHSGLEDETWRAVASASGLAVASGYSWDSCVDQTVHLYKKLLPES